MNWIFFEIWDAIHKCEQVFTKIHKAMTFIWTETGIPCPEGRLTQYEQFMFRHSEKSTFQELTKNLYYVEWRTQTLAEK